MEQTDYKIYKHNSKEYREYVEGVIKEYNSNGKKTLLFTCDNAYPLVDGVWRVLDSCTTELKRNYPQYNVILMCPDFKGDVFVKDIPVLATKSRYIASLQYQMAMPQLDGQLKRWLKKLKIDFIHCHSPFLCGLMSRKLHLKRKIPMVSTFHSQFKQDFLKATKSKFLTWLALKIIMKVFNSSNEVWTMHTASRDTLYSYGFKGKCRLLPNATRMRPLEDYDGVRNQMRAEHNLQGKTAFIFVGRLVTQKGILFIPEVLNKLKQKGLQFHMLFVGEGPDEKRLRNKVRSLNLTNEVSFIGQIDNQSKLAAYYAAADLFLFPSMYDVSSIVQIEAATYKTPVVFVKGSVTSCVVTDKVNGYLLPFELDAYAEGVWQIVQDGTIAAVGENALRDLHVEWADIVRQSTVDYERVMQEQKTILEKKLAKRKPKN